MVNPDDAELDAGEQAAAYLVAHMRRMLAAECKLQVIDDRGATWEVTTRLMSSGMGKPN
jgi:hypothetical protein